MYQREKIKSLEPFHGYLDGDPDSEVCVVVGRHLADVSKDVRSALEKAFDSLGLGSAIFIESSILAQQQDLFGVIEAVDARVLIVFDSYARNHVEQAYRCNLQDNSFVGLYGRPCVIFSNFAEMMQDESSKKQAWNLLQRLTLM